MIDLKQLSYEELQDLKRQIEAAESQKLRKYRVSFDIYFRAKRPESDLDCPESFGDSIWDVISDTYGLQNPLERMDNIEVTEVDS